MSLHAFLWDCTVVLKGAFKFFEVAMKNFCDNCFFASGTPLQVFVSGLLLRVKLYPIFAVLDPLSFLPFSCFCFSLLNSGMVVFQSSTFIGQHA